MTDPTLTPTTTITFHDCPTCGWPYRSALAAEICCEEPIGRD